MPGSTRRQKSMRIAIFSDLHLSPPPINRCGVEPSRLIERLEGAFESYDVVILNGDIFDLSRALVPGGWAIQYNAIRRAFPELCRVLGKARWTVGNHDIQLARLGHAETWTQEADGLKIFVHHGHIFDSGLKRFRTVEWGANLFAGWAARAGLDVVERGMEFVSNTSEHLTSGDTPDIEGASRVLEQGWDIVVQGHAHVQRLEVVEGGVYLNTGSQLGEVVEWGTIDTESGEVTLMRGNDVVSAAQAIRTTRR